MEGKFVVNGTLGHSGNIRTVCQLNDGRLCSAGLEGIVRIWNIDTFDEESQFDCNCEVLQVRCIFGTRLFCCLSDGSVAIWNTTHSSFAGHLRGHMDKVWCVIHIIRPEKDANVLEIATCSDDTTIKVWNLENNVCQQTLEGSLTAIHTLIQFKQGNANLVSGSDDGTIIVWESSLLSPMFVLKQAHASWISHIIELSSGLLCSSSDDESIKVWNILAGLTLCDTMIGHKDVVRTISEIADKKIITGSCDKSLKLWNIGSHGEATLVATYFGVHTDSINCVIQLTDGRIATASADCTVKIWQQLPA